MGTVADQWRMDDPYHLQEVFLSPSFATGDRRAVRISNPSQLPLNRAEQ